MLGAVVCDAGRGELAIDNYEEGADLALMIWDQITLMEHTGQGWVNR